MSIWIINKKDSNKYVEIPMGDYWPHRYVPALFTTLDKAVEFLKEMKLADKNTEFDGIFKDSRYKGVEANRVVFHDEVDESVYEIVEVETDTGDKECYPTQYMISYYYCRKFYSWEKTFEQVFEDILKIKHMIKKDFINSGEVYKWKRSMDTALDDCRDENALKVFNEWFDKLVKNN